MLAIPLTSAQRGTARARLVLLFFLTTTLLFAGLWLRQLRMSVEEVAGAQAALNQAAAVQAQIKQWQVQIGRSQEAMKRADALVQVMADPRTRRLELSGPEGRGQVFLDADHRGVALFTFDLKKPDATHAWQAWSVTADGAATSLGMLLDATDGVRSIFVPVPAGLVSVQVTLEPRAGSPAPTTEAALKSVTGP